MVDWDWLELSSSSLGQSTGKLVECGSWVFIVCFQLFRWNEFVKVQRRLVVYARFKQSCRLQESFEHETTTSKRMRISGWLQRMFVGQSLPPTSQRFTKVTFFVPLTQDCRNPVYGNVLEITCCSSVGKRNRTRVMLVDLCSNEIQPRMWRIRFVVVLERFCDGWFVREKILLGFLRRLPLLTTSTPRRSRHTLTRSLVLQCICTSGKLYQVEIFHEESCHLQVEDLQFASTKFYTFLLCDHSPISREFRRSDVCRKSRRKCHPSMIGWLEHLANRLASLQSQKIAIGCAIFIEDFQ
jgi:hypothetical protein